MPREMAEEELARFLEAMDLDRKVAEKLDEEDAKSLESVRTDILRAIEDGSLIIDDNGVATYTPRRSTDRSPLVFDEPEASCLQAADKRRDGHNTAKTIAILAAWTGQNGDRFSRMKSSDYRLCTSMLALFFG